MRDHRLATFALSATLSLGTVPLLHAQSRAEASATGSTLSPGLRAAVDRLADSARAIGVPAEPLYLKAAEGVLKGAERTLTEVRPAMIIEVSANHEAVAEILRRHRYRMIDPTSGKEIDSPAWSTVALPD